jgi:hypothetical protein
MERSESPYVFRASEAPFVDQSPTYRAKQAHMLGGIRLRYQERFAADGAYEEPWCEIGHTICIISGALRLQFDDHAVELRQGDMAHIPPGPEHRHRGSVIGDEPVRYFLTSFTWDQSKASKPGA